MPVPEEPDTIPEKQEDSQDNKSSIGSFDPATVEPVTTDPQPSSQSPADDSESQPGPDEEVSGDKGPPPDFDPRYREPFKGLLYIGALKKTFEWLGHEFVIRTLTTGELTEIALAAKPYVGSAAEMKAYQAGVVAACVMTVDAQEPPIPLTDDRQRDSSFLNRFNYVLRHWFPPTLDKVYGEYYDLEVTVNDVLATMGNRSG